MHCPKLNPNFQDITRNIEEMRYTKYSAKYFVFPATFRVIFRKIDYVWDSVRVHMPLSQQMRITQNLLQIYRNLMFSLASNFVF